MKHSMPLLPSKHAIQSKHRTNEAKAKKERKTSTYVCLFDSLLTMHIGWLYIEKPWWEYRADSAVIASDF